MKLAIISLGGVSSKSILKESKKYFSKADHIDLRKVEVRAGPKNVEVLYKGKPIEDYDCIYIRGSFKYALLQESITKALDYNSYIPLKSEAFNIGHHKFLSLLHLKKYKVPIPQTYFALTNESAKRLLSEVTYPIIMKIPSGSQGKGVMFAESISSAKSMLDTLEVVNQPYIIQEYIETDATDIRVIVLGNKVIAAMKRKASGDEHRANIHTGATGIAFVPDYDTEQAAIRAANAIGAEICGVDILEQHGKPYVIEVNLSPGLEGIEKATKTNIADKIAKYLSDRTKEFKDKKGSEHVGEIFKELNIESQDRKKEIITNLDIRAGIIRLPKIVTDLSKFDSEDEVIIDSKKGEIKITKHKIED